jgi:5-dehydro-2-deoxygluconokinase
MTPASRTERAYDVLAMGRSCIDLYAHQIGVPITAVTSFDAYVGGCPTNVSVGTRRLGLRSALLTAVGDDQVGEFVTAFLNRERVETRFIPCKPGRRTSAVILTIQPPDKFPLTFYRDNCADRFLTIDDVARAPVAESRVVFLTGTGLSHEPSRAATGAAAAAARSAGVPVVVDIDYRADQWEGAAAFAEQMRQLLRSATLAVGTEEEARRGRRNDRCRRGVAAVLDCGVEALILKRGARGSTVFRPRTCRQPMSPRSGSRC